VLGWPPSEADTADAMDIVVALRANMDRFKAYGRIMGAQFKDDDGGGDGEPLSKQEANDLIKQAFCGVGQRKGGGHS